MNRIDEKFIELKKAGRKALITFITAGDPDIETTIRIAVELEKQGADLIELGIPYSDPIAEGKVIQDANKRALKNKIKIKDIMGAVSEIRKTVKVPLLYLLYFNCILQYCPERFFSDCANVGIDGVIIPDLPFEEKGEIDKTAALHGIGIISLVSPTSKERMKKIVKDAEGFLYCVSSLGVTGMRNDFSTNFDEFFSYMDNEAQIPKAIGFGISLPEHVRRLKKYCDGLIIGSAIVKKIEEGIGLGKSVEMAGNLVRAFRKAIDEE